MISILYEYNTLAEETSILLENNKDYKKSKKNWHKK